MQPRKVWGGVGRVDLRGSGEGGAGHHLGVGWGGASGVVGYRTPPVKVWGPFGSSVGMPPLKLRTIRPPRGHTLSCLQL